MSRILAVGAGAVGTIFGGPALGIAFYKGCRFITTGNPLFVLPGGVVFGEAIDLLSDGPDPGESDRRPPKKDD